MSYKVYKSLNYFVVHDNTTSVDVIRQVRNLVRWEKKGTLYSFYYNTPNLTTVGNSIIRLGSVYEFSDLQDSTGTAWGSQALLDLYLEQWTGHICCNTAGEDALYDVQNTDGTSLKTGAIPSGETTAIEIPDITFTDSDGTPSTVPSGVDITATPCSLAPTYATADVMKTGQTTSQVTYDDGYNEFGRLVDWFTLAENNIFGNTDRFTDTLGGQTYADGIRLDHSTYNGTSRLAWYTGNYTTNGATLANACLNSYADSHGGFTHWYVPNKKQMESILYNGGASGVKLLNYAPFNINLADDFWTNTNTPITPTTAVYVYQNYNYCVVTNGNMSYVAGKHVPCRYILDSEL